MEVNCRIYKTGFNSVNIPMNLDIAESGELLLDTDLYVTTGILTEIKVEMDYNTACQADYVVMRDSEYIHCYTVLSFTMLNESTTQFTLTMDGFNSRTKEEIPQFYGQVNRYNVSVEDDDIGGFTLPENFVPNQPLEFKAHLVGADDPLQYTPIIEIVVGVSMDNKAEQYTVENTNNAVVVPEILPVTRTKIHYTNGITIDSPISKYFPQNQSGVELIVQKLRQAGMENGIVNAYCLPSVYGSLSCPITSKDDVFSGQSDLYGNSFSYNISLDTPYDVVNPKVYSGAYNKLVLISNCSGEQLEALPEEVIRDYRTPEGRIVGIDVNADPRANGKPTAYFKYYKGEHPIMKGMYGINGLEWAKTPITYTDVSGIDKSRASMLQSQLSAREQLAGESGATLGKGLLAGITGGAILGAKVGMGAGGAVGAIAGSVVPVAGNAAGGGIGAGAGALIGGTIGAVGGLVSSLVGINMAKEDLQAKQLAERELFEVNNAYSQPQISFPVSESNRDIYGNRFFLLDYHMTQEDIFAYDTYLSRFGYNVGSIAIDDPEKVMTTRQRYQYVKMNEVYLKEEEADENTMSKTAITMCKTQLQSGIRIWKELPTQQAMTRLGNERIFDKKEV